MNRREFLGGAGSLLSVSAFSGCVGLSREGIAVKNGIDGNLSVLISDIHVNVHPTSPFGFTGGEFPKRVKEILAMRPLPARVICFGDNVFSRGEAESYEFLREHVKPLRAAGIEFYFGMGNHDRRGNFLKSFPEVAANQPVPGRIVYRIDLGTCDLIMLDSLDGQERPVGGSLGDGQVQWLDRVLDEATRPVILGAHHPDCELAFGKERAIAFMRRHEKVVGWICGHGHHWIKENLFWGGGENQDVIRSLMLPTGGAWGEIGVTYLRTYPDHATATLKMIDMVWHDALKPGERRPKVFDAIVADQDGDICTFPFDRPMRGLYRGSALGKLIHTEGEYWHHGREPMGSYNG